jgi:dolichol-phosphate mannosyltransferase
MKLSLIMPAHNEEGNLRQTVRPLCRLLAAQRIPFELWIVNDHSSDGTEQAAAQLMREFPEVRSINNLKPLGFGYAVQTGLEHFAGEAVCVVMADASDDPQDVVKYYQKLQEGYECVFGSRFSRHSRIRNYPLHKLVLNRLGNWFIKILFGLPYNDITNAFKSYRREVINGVQPILSAHFNLTVELPLKAIVRGYSYAVVPINWYGRSTGLSKLKIKEMGSRYLFIVMYIFLEKLLSQGDYKRPDRPHQLERSSSPHLIDKPQSEV